MKLMNNNKKFRKSTTVIPALALMVLTAGASATGAVAWFTATRQVTATASTFTAASTTSALTITATAGQGTTKVDSPTSGVDAAITLGSSGSENYLCDASYDASSDKLYHSVLADDGTVSSFAEISDNAAETSKSTYNTGKKTNDGSHEIWYAVNWTFTFGYQTTNPNGSALLFDLKDSNFNHADGVGAGFRIAFKTSSNYRIWTNDNVKTYVDSSVSTATSSAYKSYSDNYVIQTSSSYSRKADSTLSSSTVANTPEYLGTFTQGASGVKSIEIKCTAWYEGSDAAVVNNQLVAQKAITATMKFYVRDLAAAA